MDNRGKYERIHQIWNKGELEMKYNEKYDRYVTKGGLIYRYDAKNDRLVLCKLTLGSDKYVRIKVSKPKRTMVLAHRIVYETFVGEIPQGYELDHINTIRDDNRLENLRCVTHADNNRNPLTKKHRSEAMKGKHPSNRGKTHSEFGNKFKEHYEFTCNDNPKLYNKEYNWYYKHNKTCSWEK